MRSLDSALRAPDPQHLEAVLRGAALRDERAAAAEERRRRRELEWARKERARIEALGAGAAGAAAMQGARRSRDLATRFVARLAAAGVSTFFLGLSRGTFDYTLDGSAVTTWLDRSGRGNHAAQGSEGARPAYSATAVNSRPGMTLGGDDALVTPTIDLTGYSAAALMVLFQDSDTAQRCPAEHGNGGANNANVALSIYTNNGGDGLLDVYARGNGVFNIARATAQTMVTPALITATANLALSSAEVELRKNGVNITGSRPLDQNSGSAFRNATLRIGGRDPSTLAITGAIAACALVAHTGAWSGAALTALADGEAMLAAQQGL